MPLLDAPAACSDSCRLSCDVVVEELAVVVVVAPVACFRLANSDSIYSSLPD